MTSKIRNFIAKNASGIFTNSVVSQYSKPLFSRYKYLIIFFSVADEGRFVESIYIIERMYILQKQQILFYDKYGFVRAFALRVFFSIIDTVHASTDILLSIALHE